MYVYVIYNLTIWYYVPLSYAPKLRRNDTHFFENGPHILHNPCDHTCNKTVFGIRMISYCTLDIIIFFTMRASSKLHRFLVDFNTYTTKSAHLQLINNNIGQTMCV